MGSQWIVSTESEIRQVIWLNKVMIRLEIWQLHTILNVSLVSGVISCTAVDVVTSAVLLRLGSYMGMQVAVIVNVARSEHETEKISLMSR